MASPVSAFFTDTFTEDTVAAVCDISNAQELLDRLQDASLVHRFEVDGRSRYTMHRPTRAYAAEKLSSLPSALAVRQRFIAFFGQAGDYHAKGWVLNGLGLVYRRQGRWAKAEEYYQQGLAIARELEDRHVETQTLNDLGNLYAYDLKQWTEAEDCYQKSLAIRREMGSRNDEAQIWLYDMMISVGGQEGEAQTLSNLANLYLHRGNGK